MSSPKYGNEVDIFALGLILAELLYIPPTRSEMADVSNLTERLWQQELLVIIFEVQLQTVIALK